MAQPGRLRSPKAISYWGAGTNYDAAAEPWYVIVTNTQEDGATDEWYLSFEPYAEENTPYFFDLGYSQTLVDGSLGDGMQLIVGILSIPDTALTGWGVQLTVSEGETDTGLLRISALKRPTTTEEGLPGYGGEVYIGVGNPEIVMEYEHEMNAFMTPDGGEAFNTGRHAVSGRGAERGYLRLYAGSGRGAGPGRTAGAGAGL